MNRFVPIQRTALDGVTWWVVFDSDRRSYSTYTCHGKYKTKKDCELAIENGYKKCAEFFK